MNYTRIAVMTIVSTNKAYATPSVSPIRVLGEYELRTPAIGITAKVSCHVVKAGMLPTLFTKRQTGFNETIRIPIPSHWRP